MQYGLNVTYDGEDGVPWNDVLYQDLQERSRVSASESRVWPLWLTNSYIQNDEGGVTKAVCRQYILLSCPQCKAAIYVIVDFSL
jgi:hypothetical protein